MTDQSPLLEGLKLLDLGRIYQGPWCGNLLALGGATVIKIEEPSGEPARGPHGGSTVPFAMMNSNKQALTLDLKSERGRELFLDLVAQADVVIENFSAGTMERLGLAPELLLERNPRLVYGAATAYGIDGPDRDQLGMDVTIQAYSGVMSLTGFPDAPPVKAGVPFIDIMGGSYLYGGVMTALYGREKTGRGRIVDVAMIDTVYATLASSLTGLYRDGSVTRAGNGADGVTLAPYDVYPTSDGFVAVIVITEKHWEKMCQAMGCPELADDQRFASHARRRKNLDELNSMIRAWTITRTRDEVSRALRDGKVPAAAVRDLAEVVADPHLRERGAIQDMDHPREGKITVSHSPLRYRGVSLAPLSPSRDLGADNHEIFGDWLGLSESEIESLKEDGVI